MNILTVNQCAQRLGIARETVRLMARQGRIPGAQKIGREWLIPESSLAKIKIPEGGIRRGRPKKVA